MQLIHGHLHDWNRDLPKVFLSADRHTLAKRRWRGVAEDGTEFGFDLEHPLADGDVFAVTSSAVYSVAQKPEAVLEVALSGDPAHAARLGWTIGNLHFALEIRSQTLRVADDPALRQLFEREKIPFSTTESVFKPASIAHSHDHH